MYGVYFSLTRAVSTSRREDFQRLVNNRVSIIGFAEKVVYTAVNLPPVNRVFYDKKNGGKKVAMTAINGKLSSCCGITMLIHESYTYIDLY